MTKTDAGMRADVFVTKKYPVFARSALKGLFARQSVRLNSKLAKPGYRLKPGDKVSVDVQTLNAKPESLDLPIIYMDEDVVVIDKPPGVLTHSKGALNLEPTVASFLHSRLNDKKIKGNRAGIVHRLDRGTSGVIIGARNQPSLNWLQKQFSNRKVKKTYLAIVEGQLEPAMAIIDIPLGRNPKKPQSFKAAASGKPAKTIYKVLKNIKKHQKVYSIVELEPLTGRTHQIRVHLAYIGHPVVGDPIYGNNGRELLLHAQKLELLLPGGRDMSFSSPTPKRFKEFIK